MPRKFRDLCDPKKFVFAKRMRYNPTPAEAALWARIRTKNIDGFKFRQQSVFFGYIVDFYCASARLVVEVDGSFHDNRKHYDAKRDAKIMTAGVTILRLTNDEVMHDLDRTIERIRECLHARKASG